MRTEIAFPPEPVYYIGYNDLDDEKIHYDIIQPTQILVTEKNIVEQYDNEKDWEIRLSELGVTIVDIWKIPDIPEPPMQEY
jgi:hypothetical protein